MDYTPGPWVMADSEWPGWYRIEPVQSLHDESGFREADARLIAAAPELLEVLERLLDSWSDGPPPQPVSWGPAFSNARVAIAKAKGE